MFELNDGVYGLIKPYRPIISWLQSYHQIIWWCNFHLAATSNAGQLSRASVTAFVPVTSVFLINASLTSSGGDEKKKEASPLRAPLFEIFSYFKNILVVERESLLSGIC